MNPDTLTPALLAPCGINCGVCLARLRPKNTCPGCNAPDTGKCKTVRSCRIKTCPRLKGRGQKFCFRCAEFPCARIKHLDKRYRTRYAMSPIENLRAIQALGLKEFVSRERERWKCPGCGRLLCVHRKDCLHCGQPR